jgi:hypothetical protein
MAASGFAACDTASPQSLPSTGASAGAVVCEKTGGRAMLQVFLVAALMTQFHAKGTTLTGVVKDDSGRPLAKATVFIRTAAPRQGVGVL